MLLGFVVQEWERAWAKGVEAGWSWEGWRGVGADEGFQALSRIGVADPACIGVMAGCSGVCEPCICVAPPQKPLVRGAPFCRGSHDEHVLLSILIGKSGLDRKKAMVRCAGYMQGPFQLEGRCFAAFLWGERPAGLAGRA